MLIFHVSILSAGKMAEDVHSNGKSWWLRCLSILRLMFEILPSQLHRLDYILNSPCECSHHRPSPLLLVIHILFMHCRKEEWITTRDVKSEAIWEQRRKWYQNAPPRKMTSEAWYFRSFVDAGLDHPFDSFQLHCFEHQTPESFRWMVKVASVWYSLPLESTTLVPTQSF